MYGDFVEYQQPQCGSFNSNVGWALNGTGGLAVYLIYISHNALTVWVNSGLFKEYEFYLNYRKQESQKQMNMTKVG